MKLQQAIKPGAARPVKGAFEWLERCEVKVSRTVLRGLGGQQCPLATRRADQLGLASPPCGRASWPVAGGLSAAPLGGVGQAALARNHFSEHQLRTCGMIDKDILLILIGAATGLFTAIALAVLNAWLSTRAERLKRLQMKADERVTLIFQFLAGRTTNRDDTQQSARLPKVAWLILCNYKGPRHFGLLRLNLVTQAILPLSERSVILGEITTIGRDPLNNLVLSSSEVKKIHALIRFEEDKYVFYDLSGEEGSYIKHEQVKRPARAERAILEDGDLIDIQGYILLYAERESTIRKRMILISEDDYRLPSMPGKIVA